MGWMGKSAFAGRRILIVEDKYFLADDLRQILSDQRIEVLETVATIANALSVIPDAGLIDCAVLDINLGGGHSQRAP
jgi:DNA-binding response OmpR family regulator